MTSAILLTKGAKQARQLALNDESKTPIARYHRRLIGLVVQTYKAYLEIFPEGEAIVDEIVITFIYVEMLRRMENGERL